MPYSEEYLAKIDKQRLLDGIHAAVSFTYIDTEMARLRARVALKEAAGWPLSDGELARLKELEDEQASAASEQALD